MSNVGLRLVPRVFFFAGNKPIPEEYNNEVMDMLKKHTQNENMENRSRQPDIS